MTPISPETRDRAGAALNRELPPAASSPDVFQGFERAAERLRQRLLPILASVGVRALLARALFLAKSEHPWLQQIEWQDASGCALKQTEGQAVDADVAREGLTTVLAYAVFLLITFIGEDLALPLVQVAWPEESVESCSRRKRDRI